MLSSAMTPKQEEHFRFVLFVFLFFWLCLLLAPCSLSAVSSTPLSTDAVHSTICFFFPASRLPLSAPAAVNHAESSLLIG